MADNEFEWGWYASHDEEMYTCGPEDSREAIIQAATGDEVGWHDADEDGPERLCFHIVEARKQPLDLSRLIVFDTLFDNWSNGIFYDLSGESSDDHRDVASHVTKEQWDDLEARLKAACVEWGNANTVVIMPWIFTQTRKEETVTVPLPADAEETAGPIDAPSSKES